VLKIAKTYEREVTIDDIKVKIAVKRLTVDEAHRLMRWIRETSTRGMRSTQDITIEAPEDKFESALALTSEQELKARREVADLIRDFITIVPGQVQDENDADVVAGEDIVRVFGGSREVLSSMLGELYAANRLFPQEKKSSSSPLPSASGSAPATPAPPTGDAPSPTAEPAAQ
jgi:hypothetical protein